MGPNMLQTRFQVEALLDRHGGEPPVMQYVVRQLRELGYGSVAWRVVNSAGQSVPGPTEAYVSCACGLFGFRIRVNIPIWLFSSNGLARRDRNFLNVVLLFKPHRQAGLLRSRRKYGCTLASLHRNQKHWVP